MVGFSSSPRFIEHETGEHHPERPDRIRAIYNALALSGMIARNPFPDFRIDLGALPKRNALQEIEPAPADEKWLELVHTPEHIWRVKHVCELGGGVLDHGDTPVSAHSFDVAMLGLGALLQCCDAVMAKRVTRAFAAIRPPGHHAEPDRPMGFCLFSNIAIAARYLQKQHGISRVAIVDFDVHHGNGTQACFETDPSVFYVSLHQNPRTAYPGTGHTWERGEGAGAGSTLNIPFDPGCRDAEYLAAMEQEVLPALEQFAPEVLLLSAGFDAHHDDPLAQMELSEEGFEIMTRQLVSLADKCCGGRVVSVLEGGYNLRALARSVVRHIAALES